MGATDEARFQRDSTRLLAESYRPSSDPRAATATASHRPPVILNYDTLVFADLTDIFACATSKSVPFYPILERVRHF